PDPAGRRDTLRQLAGHLTTAGRHTQAARRLMRALELHQRHAAGDRLTRADLCAELAEGLARQGREAEALCLRHLAIQEYRAVLEDPRGGRPEVAGALTAFWKLQLLCQRTTQYDQALKLIQDQAGQWPGSLIEPRLHAEEGRLQVLRGVYGPSRLLLEGVVRELESQSPLNLVELPPALLNLAVAELATGNPHRP